MKNQLIIILTLLSFIFVSFTLDKEDNKKILKAQKIITKFQNFQEAKEVINTISTNGKSDEIYLQLSSLIFDSCKEYSNAINSYSLLLNKFPGRIDIKNRIEELNALETQRLEKEKIKLEKIKACTKCNGTDKLKIIEACDACYGKGEALINCSRCRGTGRIKCENCSGKGSIKNSDGTVVMDQICNGAGSIPCPDLCNKGLVLGTCKTCRGKGNIEKIIKCDMHE